MSKNTPSNNVWEYHLIDNNMDDNMDNNITYKLYYINYKKDGR